MIKAQVKVNSKMLIELECRDDKELFAKLGDIQDVFGYDTCGKCQSTKLRYVTREDKDKNVYYEIRCESCGARLQFGAKKVGGLFPRKSETDDSGKKTYYPDGGWTKWNKEKGVAE